MALTDCGNGHLYDNSQYTSCPYCNGQNKVIDYTRRGSSGSGSSTVGPGMGGSTGGSRTVMPGMSGGSSSDSRTVMPGMGSNSGESGGGKTVGPGTSGGGTVAPEWFKKQVSQDSGSRRDGKTMIPDWMKFGNSENNDEGNEPPVAGWLVCVKGKNKGKDFRLLAKINKIRRELSNDVSVPGDKAISRENHASIAYDYKHNQFHILPGNGTASSAYVDGEPVYVPMKLQSHSRIELGNSTFLFVPLCGDQFCWNTSEQEKNG